MEWLADELYRAGNQVLMAEFAFRPGYSKTVGHAEAVLFEDLDFVFGMPLRPGVPADAEDRARSTDVIKAWASFAVSG